MHGVFSFKAKLRLRNNGVAPASRHFVTIPKKISKELRAARVGGSKYGFGEIKVDARIGPVKRRGVLFWSKKGEEFLFPIKAEIRKQLHIVDGDELHIDMTVL